MPHHLLGRLNSAYRLLASGTQPIGALAGGLIGQLVGLQAVFLMAGALGMTLLLTRWILTEGALRAPEADGEAEREATADGTSSLAGRDSL